LVTSLHNIRAAANPEMSDPFSTADNNVEEDADLRNSYQMLIESSLIE
jgi:hypothetical protein